MSSGEVAPRADDRDPVGGRDPLGRLYNDDLRPARPAERRWGAPSLFALWMNVAHNVAMYTFASGLFLLGLSPLQVTGAVVAGSVVAAIACVASGYIGCDTGAPFAVVARLSWGVFGRRFAALVRGVGAIAWYGIQTYVAALALTTAALRIDPGLQSLTQETFLGLDPLTWIAFLLLWTGQLVVVSRGMDAVRQRPGPGRSAGLVGHGQPRGVPAVERRLVHRLDHRRHRDQYEGGLDQDRGSAWIRTRPSTSWSTA